ncbi:MAG: trehalose-phosphatase [Acidimicrobiales bacterium]
MITSSAAAVADLARASSLLVVCEFDGAIAEFVADPSDARPIDGALPALQALAELDRTRVAVISGRSFDSLCCAFGAREEPKAGRIELIGSDGMEIDQMNLSLTTEVRRAQRLLLREASHVADEYPGVKVDDKPYGVALHVRGATNLDAQRAIDRLLVALSAIPQRMHSQIRGQVLEVSVLPVGQDWAIDALRAGRETRVLYAGNDQRALTSLSANDVGCMVGTDVAGAQMRVASPEALLQELVLLARKRATVLDATRLIEL